MDNIKIGRLISKTRKQRGMTQKELGQKLNVSDKTISKWESGIGLPDISSISNLAKELQINVTEILSGEISENDNNMANMKKTKLYFCETCGNIIASTNNVILNCCGKKLEELTENISKNNNEEELEISIERLENDIYVSVEHEMTKSHFISFIAYVTGDRLMVNKLYPEQDSATRFQMYGHGIIYVLCNKHGLRSKRI